MCVLTVLSRSSIRQIIPEGLPLLRHHGIVLTIVIILMHLAIDVVLLVQGVYGIFDRAFGVFWDVLDVSYLVLQRSTVSLDFGSPIQSCHLIVVTLDGKL